jgi:hypothetical protein
MTDDALDILARLDGARHRLARLAARAATDADDTSADELTRARAAGVEHGLRLAGRVLERALEERKP